MGQYIYDQDNTHYEMPFNPERVDKLWMLYREDVFLNSDTYRNFGLPTVEEDYSQIPYPEARREWEKLHLKHGRIYTAFLKLCSWIDSWALKKA